MDWKNIIDKSWTLFLDRDGVINQRIMDGYVKDLGEFVFLPKVLDAFAIFNKYFGRIILITNQQGIGKGIMAIEDVNRVHDFMLQEIENHGGRMDKIYLCPQLSSEPDNYRKPSPKMAFMAKNDFPEIDLSKSIMVGDTNSDLEFGKNAGTKTILIGDESVKVIPDDKFPTLFDFAYSLTH